MKVETKYVCEICGATYSDKSDCEACEQGHFAKLKFIPRRQYDPYAKWPRYIDVQHEETGERAVYELRYPEYYRGCE